MPNVNPQTRAIRELLQEESPRAAPAAVASARIGRDNQFARVRVSLLALAVPPPLNGRYGELSGIVVDEHNSAVNRQHSCLIDGGDRFSAGLVATEPAHPMYPGVQIVRWFVALPEGVLPPLKQDEPLILASCTPSQHFTKPPRRFTDASLVKALEEDGVGRPSTYAPTIQTILSRDYVRRIGGSLVPQKLGRKQGYGHSKDHGQPHHHNLRRSG